MVSLITFGSFLSSFCISYSVCQADIPVAINTTEHMDHALYQSTTAAVRTSALKLLVNCSLVPKFPDVRDHVATLAVENKLIKIKVDIIGAHGPLNDTYPVSVYKPHQWIVSTSLTGNSMLMLKEYFDAMSLRTLGYGVASASLTLIQEPSNCLKDAQVENVENSLRLHFLTNFEASENKLPEEAVICNAHTLKEHKTVGRIGYVCCSRTLDHTLKCSVLKESIWFQLLFICIAILQLLLVLYSPYLVPDSIYKVRNTFQTYVFKTQPGTLLKLNVKKINGKDNIERGFVKTIQHNFAHLDDFKSHLVNMVSGKVYSMYVSGVDLAVRGSKLTAEGNAPVSVMSFVRNFFVHCKLRFEVSSVEDCCNQNMCLHLPCKIVFHWYQCLGFVTMLVVGTVMLFPWLLRVWFYYEYEKEAIQNQGRVLQNRNLTLPYTGNMLSYLSPTHSLYLGIYILFLAESICYMFLPDSIKRRLKFAIGHCFYAMRQTPKLDACGFFVAHMLWPLKKFGVLGCLVLPLWLLVLPLCLLYLALEVIPIANLSFRLLVNSLYYTIKTISPDAFNAKDISSKNNWAKRRLASILVVNYDKKNKRHNQIILAVSLILSFITMWGFLFVVIDCIAFYVECAVYALVGFILNPRDTMKYISIILLIAVYGNECFSGVHSRYATYSKAINTEVQAMVGDQVSEEASKSEKEQENVAFRLPEPNVVTERMHLEAGSEGFLKWRAHRLILFLDKFDIPYIPKSFLFEMGKLNHHFCPGVIHLLYLQALLDFSLILVFLMFVFIVIFAFGQAHDISSGGQTVAALGSGFLPLVLRKFLFQSQSSTSVDKSNLKWKSMFAIAVQKYATRWNFKDIHVTHTCIEETEPERTSEYSHKAFTENSTDLGGTASDIGADETSAKLIEESNTENDIRGKVDLVVKSFMNATGVEVMTFYVPDNSVNDELAEVAVVVEKTNTDDVTIL